MDKPATNINITHSGYHAVPIYVAYYPLKNSENQQVVITAKGNNGNWAYGYNIFLVSENGNKLASTFIISPCGWNHLTYPSAPAAFEAAVTHILERLSGSGHDNHPALTDLKSCVEAHLMEA